MSVISNQRGVSIIAVVAAMLILSVMGATLISLVSTGSDVSINQMRSEQSFNVAVGGMEYVLERYSFPNYSTPLTKTLGNGSFTVNTLYPVAILVNPIIVGDTTITVSTTTGFVIPGVVKVESEYLYCNGTAIAPVRFTGCGPAVSGHATGINLFQYIITSTGTTGNAQRVVRVLVDGGGGVESITDGTFDDPANFNINWPDENCPPNKSEGAVSIVGNALSIATNVGEKQTMSDCRQQTLTSPISPNKNVDLSLNYKFDISDTCNAPAKCELSIIFVYSDNSTEIPWTNPDTSTSWTPTGNISWPTKAGVLLTDVGLRYDIKTPNTAGAQTVGWFDNISIIESSGLSLFDFREVY